MVVSAGSHDHGFGFAWMDLRGVLSAQVDLFKLRRLACSLRGNLL